MTFRIHALPPDAFAPLFALSDAELAERNALRRIVTTQPGAPCRVSLADAAPGETVILLNYTHLPAASPYQSRHAIYVREGAAQAHPEPGAVPEVLLSGHHERVRAWRQAKAEEITRERRPDLWDRLAQDRGPSRH